MVNEIRDVAGTICSKKSFEQSVAIKLVGQYPNTFEDRIGDVRISCRYDFLIKQMVARNKNLKRKVQPVQAPSNR